MHRTSLLEKLSVHTPYNDHEAAMVEALRRFVSANTDCFERSLEIGHVTGSAWILDRGRTHALLTHHRKLDKWLQLGGHADGDPDILRVAMREAREESNLDSVHAISEDIFDIDIHVIPARGSEPEHFHYDVRFLLEADRGAPLKASEESRALAWLPLSEISRLNPEESISRMVKKTSLLR